MGSILKFFDVSLISSSRPNLGGRPSIWWTNIQQKGGVAACTARSWIGLHTFLEMPPVFELQAVPSVKGQQKVLLFCRALRMSGLCRASGQTLPAQYRPRPVSRASAVRPCIKKILCPFRWSRSRTGSCRVPRGHLRVVLEIILITSDKPPTAVIVCLRVRSSLRALSLALPLATIQTSDEISNAPSFTASRFLDFGRT